MTGFGLLLGRVLWLLLLAAAAFQVFRRVGMDYQAHKRLSRPVAVMQTGFFFIYALSSYAFLDSRILHVGIRGGLLLMAILLMVVGLLIVAASMPLLGRQSFGGEVRSLRTEGPYRYSRNPQLVGAFLFIVGYAMLWPSWEGGAWAALWLAISHLMVRAEEGHLQNVFGEQYRAYCARTPRFLGWPRH